MDIFTLWQEKSKECKNLIGTTAANNFANDINFHILSNKTEQQFNVDTKFQAASLSKLIGTIVSALYLETQQKSLHFSLFEQLQVPVCQETTLKHIFSHSAGFSVSGFPGYDQRPIPSISEVISGGSSVNTPSIRQSLEFGKYSYSGGGYCVAQEYIERISGRKISQLANELLFAPLNLKNTTFDILENDTTCACGYDENGKKVGLGWHLYPETIAAGLWTTAREYLTILNELIKGYYNESHIISQSIAKEILTPCIDYQEDNKHHKYAGGIRISDNIYWHSGSNAGYKCLFAFDLTKRKIFVIMSNDDTGGDILTL